ncbi:acetaldehyde dehydrogenase (acetylating) [Streptomyces sp. AgN23]|uniref:acetaldehyde dehydrogenase (acetylating) n=1 Tax=Streptomyces sp. AgN23 TaxID=1188315 RepID=UPI001B31FC3F|nr:acetaldehyde dehydrogenase (acetylating) [Streptomyces sp. AgN23]QTI88018.1 acetaldehyde dehydrogenase (acetylating) [Streptomyces sp. AgN23]
MSTARKRSGRLSAAVLGAGLIGVDLAAKIMRSRSLDCRLVVARDDDTPGLRHATRLGLPTATGGLQSLVDATDPFDVVFDATSAVSHAEHAERLKPFGTMLVDLTPSKVGRMVVPTVNGADVLEHGDINMISCGGQASIPILHAIARRHRIDYVEVVATAASLSVGRSTRLNLDEYIETTQDAVREFTGVKDVKAILNVSPAKPPATFRVAMSVLGQELTAESVRAAVTTATESVRAFAGGFQVTACVVEDGKALIAIEVTSSGDRIPRYAGNLDIINSAALHVAELYAAAHLPTAGAVMS